MSTPVTMNGVVYPIPVQGDTGWGPPLTRYLVALPSGMLQKTGGTFTLTADVNFGPNFGLFSQYFSSRTTNSATAGVLRLARPDLIEWRNQANSGNNALGVDSSDNLVYNGTSVPTGLSTLPNGQIWIGSAGNLPVAQTLTGDVTVTNAGVTAIGSGKIVNAQVNASAAIAYSKLNLTGSIVNADIFSGASIAYSKLNLSGSILNADIANAAAIAVNKLAALTVSSNVRSDGSGFLTTGAIDLSTSDVAGNLGVTHLNSGTSASGTTFWRGDGTWATPSGSGTVNSGTAGNLTLYPTSSTTVGDTYVQNTKNITLGIVAQGSRSANIAYTVPNPGNAVTAADFVLTEGAQTLNGNKTLSGTTNLSGLTLSTALALDASKNIISVTNTGSGNNVLATSPTLVTPVLGAASATSLSFSSTSGIIGTTTNNNAAAGSVGEYIESVVGNTNLPTSTQYGDLTSISLTAGDWEVTAIMHVNNNVSFTSVVAGISVTSGNATTGLVDGSSRVFGIPSATVNTGLSVPCYRLSLSGTTTVYFKMSGTYSGTTPQVAGRISARRFR